MRRANTEGAVPGRMAPSGSDRTTISPRSDPDREAVRRASSMAKQARDTCCAGDLSRKLRTSLVPGGIGQVRLESAIVADVLLRPPRIILRSAAASTVTV